MLDPNTEIALRDISRRLVLLVAQVGDGDPIDIDLLIQLNELSQECYIKHVAGYQITETEIQQMIELLSLLEMRTTLIYENPPNM